MKKTPWCCAPTPRRPSQSFAGDRRDRKHRSGRRSGACWPGSPQPFARSFCSGCLPIADCRGTSGQTPWPGGRPPSLKMMSPSTRGPSTGQRREWPARTPSPTGRRGGIAHSWLAGCRPRCDASSERPPSTSTRSGRATGRGPQRTCTASAEVRGRTATSVSSPGAGRAGAGCAARSRTRRSTS